MCAFASENEGKQAKGKPCFHPRPLYRLPGEGVAHI